MKEPKIAIIIINWNTYQLTFNCLKSLKACTYKNKTIFLVDNGSKDGSGDKIALEFPDINFIKNEKNGWRFINNNIGKTFYMKYQANKLQTFDNSKDFLLEELKYISKSSPLNSQQLIIPKYEVERLLNKFINLFLSSVMITY